MIPEINYFVSFVDCFLLLRAFCAADYSSPFGAGAVVLDDCNFHESVRLDSFDVDRTLTLVSAD